jgi:hypothetical protein
MGNYLTILINLILIAGSESMEIGKAETWYKTAFIFSCITIILTLIASILLYVTGNRVADTKISAANATAESAKADAARAKDSAAAANAEAAKANERALKLENSNLTLEKEVAEARTKQTEAEHRTTFAAQRAVSRFLNGEILLKALEGKPKLRVEILFKPDDEESYIWAGQISGALGEKGAGWTVVAVRPLTEADAITSIKEFNRESGIPLSIRAGASNYGVGIVSRQTPNPEDMGKSALSALQFGLMNALALNTLVGGESRCRDYANRCKVARRLSSNRSRAKSGITA